MISGRGGRQVGFSDHVRLGSGHLGCIREAYHVSEWDRARSDDEVSVGSVRKFGSDVGKRSLDNPRNLNVACQGLLEGSFWLKFHFQNTVR